MMRIIISVFLGVLLMYANKAYSQVELFNEDSAYIKECLLINSEEKDLKDKQYATLLNIVSHYIKEENDNMQRSDGEADGLPIIVRVTQEDDYKGNSVYSVNMSLVGSKETALTNIAKIQDRYVFFQLDNEKLLSKEEIPELFLEYWLKEEQKPKPEIDTESGKIILKAGITEIVAFTREDSWVVLMCKDSTKHIVVKNVWYMESCVAYFEAFSCIANPAVKSK
ncbi:MAG: hypothetical protein FWH36_07650 [Lentimicrobiaceae bacterium]|nr:hypothetical protein [Lentimicrobiaceae bacterium]